MGNIINDIIDDVDIEIKPNKRNLIIKWIIRISLSLIVIAFILGQLNTSFFNKIDDFDVNINKNTAEINDLKKNVDAKFNKMYADGAIMLTEFQEYRNTRLSLIIDYRDTDKELLKKILGINSTAETKRINECIMNFKNDTSLLINK